MRATYIYRWVYSNAGPEACGQFAWVAVLLSGKGGLTIRFSGLSSLYFPKGGCISFFNISAVQLWNANKLDLDKAKKNKKKIRKGPTILGIYEMYISYMLIHIFVWIWTYPNLNFICISKSLTKTWTERVEHPFQPSTLKGNYSAGIVSSSCNIL